MFKKQKLETLDVLSNFLMNAIANDPDICEPFFRLIISILLEIEVGRIIVRAQTFLPGTTPDLRGIQLDVEIKEYLDDKETEADCRLYSIEPQLYQDNLPKRNRFYQAKKDSKGLKSGEKNWNKLPDLYMVTITNYDPFGEDSMVYTFENSCKEFPDLEYKDGLKFIYFNAKGNLNTQKAKKELLTYLNSSKIENVTNNDIAQLHNYVSNLKQSAEVQGKFMTMGEWMDAYTADVVAEAEQTGFRKGEESGRVKVLLDILADLGAAPDDFQARLQNIDDVTLKCWTKFASRAESMEEFLEQI
ncbi:MAG: hypothetical protein IKK59_06105 [Lachnospiraceae bacterium]|nr:hypothetical protein [Lachnospiraceae bacterium]